MADLTREKLDEFLTAYAARLRDTGNKFWRLCDGGGFYALIAAARKGLEAEAKPYHYIGKDGKAITARELEDQRDEAVARAETAERERDEAKELALAHFTNKTTVERELRAAEASLAEADSTNRALSLVNEQLTARVAKLEAALQAIVGRAASDCRPR